MTTRKTTKITKKDVTTKPAKTAKTSTQKKDTKPVKATTRKTTRPKVEAPMIVRMRREPSYEEIAKKAYSFFEHRGYAHGFDEEDWFKAETELRASL